MGFLRQSAVLGGTAMVLIALSFLRVAGNASVLSAAGWIVPVIAALLLLVAIRFHESRTALAASALLAGAFASNLLGLGSEASRWMMVVVAVDLAFASTLNEPTIDWEVFGYWCGWLIASFGTIIAIDHLAPRYLVIPPIANLVDARMIPVLVGFLFVVMMFLIKRDPVTGGLSLAILPMAVAIGDPYKVLITLGISAIVSAMALIERSYWIAYFDELTGLKGRRAFTEAFDSLHTDYCLAVVDIDHFKNFNDTYGHDVGDQVLRKVAAHLARVTGGGQPYRCGGEEFVVIFKGRTAADAMSHAERLRKSIEEGIFHVRGPERSQREREERRKFHKKERQSRHEVVRVTVSIGVAEAPDGFSPQQVFKAADKALYRAKRASRNRVELARRAGGRAADMIPEQVR